METQLRRSLKVRRGKVTQVSILSHKDSHMAKILPFLEKIRVLDAPCHTVKFLSKMTFA